MRFIIFAASVMIVSSPVFAHKEGTDQKTPYDPNKVICKSEDVIGSRLQAQKRCMTGAQWADLQREQYKTMDRIQGRGENNKQ